MSPPKPSFLRVDDKMQNYLLRHQTGRVEQARRFVSFVEAEPGSTVVEVAAGTGRVTFDAGLAERIGPSGRLIFTEPDEELLAVARRRAQELGCGWVEFIAAQAEELPLPSGCADLVLGASFLQYADAERSIREMVRLVRPGGRLALLVGTAVTFPPVWRRALAPIREEYARIGQTFESPYLTEEQVEELVRAASVKPERVETDVSGRLSFPDVEGALRMLTNGPFVATLVRGLPEPRRRPLVDGFLQAVAELFPLVPPEDRVVITPYMSVVARRPAAAATGEPGEADGTTSVA